MDTYARLGLEGRSVLCAVSGGADSVALLVGTASVRERLRLRVEVCTVDHGVRPESRAEARAVGSLCEQLGVPCHVRTLALAQGPGLEARARQARYEALEAVRRERGLSLVATAHSASDQAETLLMRLARGASTRGAVGIREARGTLVRPVLSLTRAELVASLKEQGVGYATDEMNDDPAFLRVRVRHDALPALSRAAGFPVDARLASYARLAAEDDALLSDLADAAWERVRLADGALDAVAVRALEVPLRRRVLARLLAAHDVVADAAMVERALRAVEQGGSATVGRALRLRATGGRVRCVASSEVKTPSVRAMVLTGQGASGVLEGTGWCFRVESREPPPGMHGLALARDVLWPLTVRTRRPGDRVRAGEKQRRLQDVLVDLRVPAESRDSRPVVLDAEGTVVWLPGLWTPPSRAEVSGHYLWAAPVGPSNHQDPSL
ncbi:tRNA lysidine(34) synthetase TilS [Myxococcus sp. AB025B]|uniref:tRNA lysidine(34) synthetase TilS n=1 Tax=Myxococcus sp. AB025B TaxID=2562794 RepID=UPI001E596D32|nr:tRNA lysidine(34) synthetase TilS [Myxococcus sp. AB025B]